MYIELNVSTLIEPSGRDDLVIAATQDAKKLYFKALDAMERDQWLKALLDERAKAPIVTEDMSEK
jgi:hypothetical protein